MPTARSIALDGGQGAVGVHRLHDADVISPAITVPIEEHEVARLRVLFAFPTPFLNQRAVRRLAVVLIHRVAGLRVDPAHEVVAPGLAAAVEGARVPQN